MANVAEILLRALFEDRGASRGVRQLSGDVEGLGRAAGSADAVTTTMGGNLAALGGKLAGIAGGYLAAKGAMDLWVSSAQKAIAAIESENLFTVGMGRFANQANAWAREVSSALRLSETEVKRQLGTWQTMLESMGLVGEKAFDLSTRLTVLAQDMASFYNLPVDEAFTKLSAGIAGEVEPLKRLGILVNEQTVQQYAYAKGIAHTGEEMTNSQKVLARFGVIMEATTQAQGDLNRTLESPANLLRAIGAQWDSLQEELGKFTAESPTFIAALKGILEPLQFWRDVLRDIKDASIDLRQVQVADAGDPTKIVAAYAKQLEEARATLEKLKSEYRAIPAATRNQRPENWTPEQRSWWDVSGPVSIPAYDESRKDRIVANLEGEQKRAAELRIGMERLQARIEQLTMAKGQAEVKAKAHADALAKEKQRLEEQAKVANEAAQKERDRAAREAETALRSALEQYDPSARKVREYKETLATLTTALKEGRLTEEEYAQAVAKVHQEVGKTAAKFAQASTEVSAFEQAVAGISTIKPAQALVAPMEEALDSAEFDRFKEYLADSVAYALGDAITTVLTAGDIEEAAGQFGRILTQAASSSLSSGLSVLLRGGSVKEAGVAAGLWDPNANNGQGGISLSGVGQLAGGLISYRGQQSGNRTQAALGGALSGAASGSAAGIGWGTLVGAIVGAAMGYMSAGKSTTPYHLQWGYGLPMGNTGWSWYGSNADVSGMGDLEERGIARKMTDTYRQNVLGFRDLLYTMRQSVTGVDLKGLGFDLGGKTGDFNALLTEVLTSTIPRQVLEKYSPAITTGLGAMGVSEGRITTEMGRFLPTEGDIGPAVEVFKEWVGAILQLQDAQGGILTSLPDIVAQLEQSPIDTWREGFAKTTDQIGRLSAELGQLTTEEQIARAQEAAELIEAQVQSSMELIANLKAMQDQFAESVTGIKEGRLLKAAQSQGPEALQGFLERRFLMAARDINEGMLDPDQLAKAQQDVLTYGQALLDLADQLEASITLWEQLGDSLEDLDGQLGVTLEERLAKLTADSQTAFSTAAGTALEKLTSLRIGLDGLTSEEKLQRLSQIKDLTSQTLTLADENLQRLVAAGENVGRTFDDLFESFDAAVAEKQGPKAKGEYLIDKLFKLQEQLGGATSPEEIEAISQAMANYAQQLFAMEDTINLRDPSSGKVVDVLTWLRPWLQQQEAEAQAKVEAWKVANQAVIDSLREGLAGLSTVVGGETIKLQTTIEALRTLVDQGLSGAVRDSGDLITSWSNEVVAGLGTLKTALGTFEEALTGEDVGLITSLNTVKKTGDELGDSFDRLKDKLEKLIAAIDGWIPDDSILPAPSQGITSTGLGSDPLATARAWAVRSSYGSDVRVG